MALTIKSNLKRKCVSVWAIAGLEKQREQGCEWKRVANMDGLYYRKEGEKMEK